jgi:hypothetical protein
MLYKQSKFQNRIPLIISIAILLISMSFFTFIISKDIEGVPVGNEFRANTYTFSNQWLSKVAMNSTGSFVITWASLDQDGSAYGIFAQRYNDTGDPVGIEFLVNTNTANNQIAPSVAMDSNGNFIIAWTSNQQDGSNGGIFAKRYDSNGNELSPPPSALKGGELGNEFRVNNFTASEQVNPSIAMNSTGHFVVVWQSLNQDGDDFGIYAQPYSDNGTPIGDEFQVNMGMVGAQHNPSVAMNSSGSFVITWEDNPALKINARRYDKDATPLGGEFQVNSGMATMHKSPSIAMDIGGNFVIAWAIDTFDGDGMGIYAKHYDSNGIEFTPPQRALKGGESGNEFRANTYITGNQEYPSVAMNDTGNFVISWSGEGASDTLGIYAVDYDGLGNPVTEEFRISTNITSDQERPSSAISSGREYVIAWWSMDQDGSGYGVFAQRFNITMPLKSVLVQVSNITSTSASISWSTNLPANSSVDYGYTKSHGNTSEDNNKTILHRINLTNLELGRLYHFKIASYNDSANYIISLDFTFTTKFPIDLMPGWNMISVPLNQTDTDLTKVLGNISGDYDAVQWFDITDSVDPWKHYHTGKPLNLNDLTDMNRFKGFWIHMKNETTLFVDGTAPQLGYINQITLYNGWNFVGYPSLIERSPVSSGLPVEVDLVQWYNASSGLWESWDPGASPDTLNLLKPGQGLWVHYTGASDVWSLEYVN